MLNKICTICILVMCLITVGFGVFILLFVEGSILARALMGITSILFGVAISSLILDDLLEK